MKRNNRKFTSLALVLLLVSWGGACIGAEPDTANSAGQNAQGNPVAAAAQEPAFPQHSDLVAKVEDEEITYGQLNTIINSSAMVGLSIPALGTPERHQAVLSVLDKVITANLLYLDALDKGKDRLPEYQEDIRRFEDAVIASLYRSQVMIGDIPVSQEEIEAYYKKNIKKDVELNDDVRLAIEAKLRKQKLQALQDSLRERLREGVRIEIDKDKLKSANTYQRKDEDVIVHIDDEVLTWGDIKVAMRGADHKEELEPLVYDSDEERMKRLQSLIDEQLLTMKGRAAGLDQDPAFKTRTAEFHKTRLINMHREDLIADWQPSEEELQAFFEEHRDEISMPEARKVQMVVVKTREEAEDIKKKIEGAELTMYQAAQEYSLVPGAKQNLGEIGWVSQGSGFPELDEFTFLLEPGELGGPVQSPAGWHLVKVLDVRDAQLQYLSEPQTRKETLRRYLKEKLDNYVVDLRLNKYTVVVDDENLHRLFQEEADWIAALNEKAKQQGSVTQERVKEMEKWITP